VLLEVGDFEYLIPCFGVYTLLNQLGGQKKIQLGGPIEALFAGKDLIMQLVGLVLKCAKVVGEIEQANKEKPGLQGQLDDLFVGPKLGFNCTDTCHVAMRLLPAYRQDGERIKTGGGKSNRYSWGSVGRINGASSLGT
jgi:hypothetical protein